LPVAEDAQAEGGLAQIEPKYKMDKIPDPVRTSDADLTMPLK